LTRASETDDHAGDQTNWLSSSSPDDVAEECSDLEEVSFQVLDTSTTSVDLGSFFSKLHPQAVSLEFDSCMQQMLISELLSSLSSGDRLRSLAMTSEKKRRTAIEPGQLGHFAQHADKHKLFPGLERLDVYVQEDAVSLLPKCFPTITWLRLEISTSRRDESILKPIASMTQLQSLEVLGRKSRDEERDHHDDLPARAFIHLGSLTQLKSLDISSSFFPMSKDDPGDDGLLGDKLTREDASNMFSTLTALEHLSVYIDGYCEDDHLLKLISEVCPELSSLELIGELRAELLILAYAPVFRGVRQLTIGYLRSSLASCDLIRMLDNFAPKLERLIIEGESTASRYLSSKLARFKKTSGWSEVCNSYGESFNPLILRASDLSSI
jgi:hypothetical protein